MTATPYSTSTFSRLPRLRRTISLRRISGWHSSDSQGLSGLGRLDAPHTPEAAPRHFRMTWPNAVNDGTPTGFALLLNGKSTRAWLSVSSFRPGVLHAP